MTIFLSCLATFVITVVFASIVIFKWIPEIINDQIEKMSKLAQSWVVRGVNYFVLTKDQIQKAAASINSLKKGSYESVVGDQLKGKWLRPSKDHKWIRFVESDLKGSCWVDENDFITPLSLNDFMSGSWEVKKDFE